jgi:hypothetical protein
MTFVTVFRHVPKPITGMIGILYDPDFDRFEANLDWLETTGVLVEQFDPSTAQNASPSARWFNRSWPMKENGLCRSFW